jgi:hypothetical protein
MIVIQEHVAGYEHSKKITGLTETRNAAMQEHVTGMCRQNAAVQEHVTGICRQTAGVQEHVTGICRQTAGETI